MKMTLLNKRQSSILATLRGFEFLSASNVADKMEGSSLTTIKRDLALLSSLGLVVSVGKGRGAGYKLTLKGRLFTPVDVKEYMSLDLDKRVSEVSFNENLFKNIPTGSMDCDNLLKCLLIFRGVVI